MIGRPEARSRWAPDATMWPEARLAAATARATALARQDGVLVKSGATTRRYLGTVRTNGSVSFEDAPFLRHIWNVQNQVRVAD